ncbi:MAG: sigma-54-dependent Fis family transcriptional regulator [Deltaproteobacteria bacterium]|jgi:DNA-binding NtrC family response regulator|nr:sigma-54-dependent Fis family transcriptional regulator [Deltaproteobacteria bacterium]MBT4067469.1 sigma-54-dependent Fis family transcriptional regulator [Candidatus Neomarinimicrobiota bacterium]MBT5176833.1 sigma-54-dependent Fis family transcriptional regulator [Candidatus Neomarinimicrobiota bacterium]
MVHICLVEDDPIMGESLAHRFTLERLTCHWFQDARSALDAVKKEHYSVLISDIRLPDMDGESMFKSLIECGEPPPPTLFITGYGGIDQAVRLLKLGAQDYITKPFDLDLLLSKLRSLCPGLFPEKDEPPLELMLGISEPLQKIQRMLSNLGKHDVSILFTGESGVGKEYAARYLHDCSGDKGNQPFIATNCAAIPESLLETELFGHEKGAFTGAIHTRRGVFEQANNGTLFLDEIGDMPLSMQVKLLRAIQERSISRIGGEKMIPVNLRLISATNHDPVALVENGKFREDLFYRINVIHIHIPPLRERQEDILWFASKFMELCAREQGERRVLNHSGEQYLFDQPWKGNLRELKHCIQRACILSGQETIGASELDVYGVELTSTKEQAVADLKSYLEVCEQRRILQMLEKNKWRIGDTASTLGISRKSLWEKMKKFDISNRGH